MTLNFDLWAPKSKQFIMESKVWQRNYLTSVQTYSQGLGEVEVFTMTFDLWLPINCCSSWTVL